MSAKKFVQDTLTMPSNLPLFNYNINFEGLRTLIQSLNIQANQNTQQIKALKEELATKLHSQRLQEQQQILNSSLKLGINSHKVLEESQKNKNNKYDKQQADMSNMECFGWKMEKLTHVVQDLVKKSLEHHDKIHSDDHRHQKNIDDSFRRIDERVESSLASMTKNINLYFSETNKKLAEVETNLNTHKRQTTANIQAINNTLNQKISDTQLKAALNGIGDQVKSSILADLNDDNMKRLTTLNQFSNKLKQHMKDSEIKIKSAKQTINQLAQKVNKSLPLQSFEIQKHKIYEKLGDYKIKIEDLTRKNQQFIDFRKGYYETNQRIKHDVAEIEDKIKKLGEKGSTFKKIQDIGTLLENLNPHLICEISSQVKLHEKQIGQLQKKVLYLENQLQSTKGNNSKMPEINNGQNAEMIVKIIKEYMTNIDFQGRVKRAQKDIHDISQRNSGVAQLQKKFFLLSKDVDMGSVMKQLKRKSDEDNTRRDFKILDSKIESLLQFYRQTRKDIEDLYKRSNRSVKQTGDSVSLTTKKLYSPYCLSCTHDTTRTRPQSSRNFRRTKADMSLDSPMMQHLKNSMHVRGTN